MEVNEQKIAEWAGRDFGGLTKEELRAACKHPSIGISIAPADGLETLRRKLLEKFGKWEQKPTSVAPIRQKPRTPPNLRSITGWQGRCHRIRLQASKENGDRPVPVSWEGETYWMDPKAEYQDVPEPIYQNLKDAKSSDITHSEWDNKNKTMNHTWTTVQRYPFEDFGITPGTENLPKSLIDWQRADCRAHDFYAKESRDGLEKIWARMTDGARPNKDDKDRNTDYWREQVLILLGLIDEAMPAVEDAA